MSWRPGLTVSARSGEIAGAAALLLFALAIVWEALRMPAGTAGAPGPGYFPRALGVLLAVVSAGLLVRALRGVDAAGEAIALGHRDVAIAVLALVGLALLFEPAGYVISATLFMLVLLRAFARLGWAGAAIAAVATAVVSWYAFVKVLGVRLPAGLLPLP